MQLLLDALQNDALLLVCLLAGCLLVGSRLERRTHFALRWALILLLQIACSMAENKLQEGLSRTAGSLAMEIAMMSRYIVIFLLFALGVLLCWHASVYTALFCTTVSYCIQNIAERTVEIIRVLQPEMPTWADRLLLAAVMAAALYGFARLFVWNDRAGLYDNYERLDSRMLVLCAVAVTGLNIVLDMLVRGEVNQAGSTRLEILACIISAAISLMALIISMSQIREAKAQRQKEIAGQMLEADRRRYEQEKITRDAINIKCHDIRHQIAALGDVGYRKELESIGELIDVYDCRIATDNAALDVVLSGKAMACAANHITLTCVADGRRMSFMEEADIYALFGNILDNAMEAAGELAQEEKRIISLTVRNERDFLIIEEENYYKGELAFENGLPQTQKSDRTSHGFGMRSIRLLAEKYGGDLKIRAQDGIYTISLLFPLKEETAA